MVEVQWVIDTAPLVAVVAGAARALGREARRAARSVELGRARFAVPTLCLFEVAQLEERGRLTLGMPFEEWCERIARSPGLLVCSLDQGHVSEARALPTLRDPFDRLIAGTAIALGVPLVTADVRIASARRLSIVW